MFDDDRLHLPFGSPVVHGSHVGGARGAAPAKRTLANQVQWGTSARAILFARASANVRRRERRSARRHTAPPGPATVCCTSSGASVRSGGRDRLPAGRCVQSTRQCNAETYCPDNETHRIA